MVNASGLATVRSTLEADGYQIEVREVGDRVGVQIVATPEACEDCLVPKPLMRTMLTDALGVPEQFIDLAYPGE
jgi:hypothetical protein